MQTFDTTTFQHTLDSTDSFNAFRNGDISLGELASSLNQSIETTLKILSDLKIPIANYPIEEELATIDRLGL
jgi:predicted HTH domain antitoxin